MSYGTIIWAARSVNSFTILYNRYTDLKKQNSECQETSGSEKEPKMGEVSCFEATGIKQSAERIPCNYYYCDRTCRCCSYWLRNEIESFILNKNTPILMEVWNKRIRGKFFK